MSGVPPELIAALRAQRERWCAVRERGARRVGWKLGIGRRERIGGEPVIGYLTSATQLDPGATYYAEGAEALHADAEVAIQLRETVSPDAAAPQLARAIGAYAPAIEIVDLTGTDDPVAIVAGNVWHRAFALGPAARTLPATGAPGRLLIDNQERDRGRLPASLVERLTIAARLLRIVGDRLEPGDWVITGSVAQTPVAAGDDVTADFEGLGRASLMIR